MPKNKTHIDSITLVHIRAPAILLGLTVTDKTECPPNLLDGCPERLVAGIAVQTFSFQLTQESMKSRISQLA